MTYLKKIGKSFILALLGFFLLTLLTTTLYHFSIISNNVYNILKLVSILFVFFLSSYSLGKHSEKQGWLEGLKLGGILIFTFFLITSLLGEEFQLKILLYDILLLLVSLVGGMVGINRKKDLA